jgi:hypothetical protein
MKDNETIKKQIKQQIAVLVGTEVNMESRKNGRMR